MKGGARTFWTNCGLRHKFSQFYRKHVSTFVVARMDDCVSISRRTHCIYYWRWYGTLFRAEIRRLGTDLVRYNILYTFLLFSLRNTTFFWKQVSTTYHLKQVFSIFQKNILTKEKDVFKNKFASVSNVFSLIIFIQFQKCITETNRASPYKIHKIHLPLYPTITYIFIL